MLPPPHSSTGKLGKDSTSQPSQEIRICSIPIICGFSTKRPFKKNTYLCQTTSPKRPPPPPPPPPIPDLGISFCPFTSESCQFFFLSCNISFPGWDWALTSRLPAGPRNSQRSPVCLAPSQDPRLGQLLSQPCLFRRSRFFLRLQGPLASPGPSQVRGTPTQPERLRSSSGTEPCLAASFVLPAAAPVPSPPSTWLRPGRPGAFGTSQNREQLLTSGRPPLRGSRRTQCGRRGRDSALAFRLPTRAGKLRPRARGTSTGCRVREGQPVQSPNRPDSCPRSLDHTRRWRAGRGAGLGASAPPRNAQGARPDQLAARKLLSPSLYSPLTSETHLPAGPGTRARTSGPPCAHPFPRAPPGSPSHACGSQPLPRAPSRTPTRPGRAFPAPPLAGLRAAPAGVLAPGSPTPGLRPASARRARGRNPGRRAERSEREARGARRWAGRGRALAHSRRRTRRDKLSHRH